MDTALHLVGGTLLYGGIALLCLAGLVLSGLSFSGTWLVVLAAVLAMIGRESPFPGWGSIAGMAAVAAVVEVLEFFASYRGVVKRGGSKLGGLAAMGCGLVGAFVGGTVIPVWGVLPGLVAGSFGGAFAYEYHRMKHREKALHIAWGTLFARLAVIGLKVGATLGMSLYLVLGMFLRP